MGTLLARMSPQALMALYPTLVHTGLEVAYGAMTATVVPPSRLPCHVPVASRSVLLPPPVLLNQPLVRSWPCISRAEIFRPKRAGSSGPKKGRAHCVAARFRMAT